jgi:hypothetical protein
MKIIFMLAAIAAFLAVSVGEVRAALIEIHHSSVLFMSSGGTIVRGCIVGCGAAQDFTIGTDTGSEVFRYDARVNIDNKNTGTTTDDTTIFTYSFGYSVPDVTSFHIANAGFLGVGDPIGPIETNGGVFTQDPTYWHLVTETAGGFTGVCCLVVTVPGIIPVGFADTYLDTTALHTAQRSPTGWWLAPAPIGVTAVPLPPAVILFGAGLMALAGLGARNWWQKGQSFA